MVELLLTHHLARSLLEESVVGDGVRVIGTSGPAKSLQRMGRPIYTLRQVSLQSLAHTGMQVTNRQAILQFVGCASFLRVCWSLSEGLNLDVYL